MALTFSVVKEYLLENGIRILKVFEFGAKTANVIAPFGDDSAALKDMIAIYGSTSNVGESIIIGYINKNQIATPGEKRIFSLKEDGSLSFAIHLKNDQTCEIGGNADFAVRYNKLETAFNNLKTDMNNFITVFNSHVHISASPGSPNAPTLTSGAASAADITPAKIAEIKVP